MKSPKVPLRALKQSCRQQPKAPPWYLFSNTSSGCLQGRRHVPPTITSNTLWLVRFRFLYLPVLLERPDLLLWWMPSCRQTQKPSRGPKTISPNSKRKKSPLRSRKPPSAWSEQKKSKKYGWCIYNRPAGMVYRAIMACLASFFLLWEKPTLSFLRMFGCHCGWISPSRLRLAKKQRRVGHDKEENSHSQPDQAHQWRL